MRSLKLFFLLVLTLIFASNAFSQQAFYGTVVDVIDGKTAVVQLNPQNRITAELDYIEIPEPEQQLNQTVKDHLKNLVLGKEVEFVARVLMPTRLIGRMYLRNGYIDISQQMLRDGAAWYAVAEKIRQNPTESENYQLVEAQAKLEKRGVWGIENLKPAWEFRAEREKAKKDIENAQNQMVSGDGNSSQKFVPKPRRIWTVEDQQKFNANLEMWADVRTKPVTGYVGLFSHYIPEINIGYTYTVSSFLDLTYKKARQKVECRVFYVYQGDKPDGVMTSYFIGFLSESKVRKFQQTNNLTVMADKQKITFGKAVSFWRPTGTGFAELLFFKISDQDLNKIAKAKNLQVTLGGYSGAVKDNLSDLSGKLLKKFN
jgi:endonuclease YncB( thermonuclease family)